MAPLRKLPAHASKPLKPILKKSSESTLASSSKADALFPTSKKDKRQIKHAQFISKVTKSASTKKSRRRRKNDALMTTLDSLADALPDGEDSEHGHTGSRGHFDQHVNIIKRKSIKSRPGAMKRREKIDSTERDRFAKNMAQLATPKATSSVETLDAGNNQGSTKVTAPSTSDRWAALRGFISQTLETRPDSKPVAT